MSVKNTATIYKNGGAEKPLTGSGAPTEQPKYEGQVYVDTDGGITYSAVGGKWVRDVQTMDGGIKGLTSNVEGKPYVQWAQIDVTADEVENRNMEINGGYTSGGSIGWQGWGVYLASYPVVKGMPRPLYFGEKIDGETIAIQFPAEVEDYINGDNYMYVFGIPITTNKDLLCDVMLTTDQFRVIRDNLAREAFDSFGHALARIMVKKDPNRQNGYIVYFATNAPVTFNAGQSPHNRFGICTLVLPECVATMPVGGISVNGGIAQGKGSFANGQAAVAIYDGSVAIGKVAVTRRENQVVIKNGFDGISDSYADATTANDDVVITYRDETIAVRKGVVYYRNGWHDPYNVTERAPNVKALSYAPDTKPDYVGQEYLDTTNKKTYKAFGTSSVDDWVAMN